MYLFKGTCKQWACRLLHRESVMCQGRLQMICLSFSGPDYLRGSSIPVQLVTMNMHWLLYYWEFLLCNFKTILKLSVLSHAAVEKKNDFMMKSLNFTQDFIVNHAILEKSFLFFKPMNVFHTKEYVLLAHKAK